MLLLLADVARGRQRLGRLDLRAGAFGYGRQGARCDVADDLKRFFAGVQALNAQGLALAYHDKSDGGLFATLVEMQITARTGLTVTLDSLGDDASAALFNEELGAVIPGAARRR